MPRKRQTKPADTPAVSPEGQAVLDALRSNLNLLGELAARYEVAFQPERPAEMPVIHCPQDVHNLLGPEMSAPGHQEQRPGPTDCISGER